MALLKGVSPKTVAHYWQSWSSLKKFCQSDSISRTEPVNFVIYLKQSGLKALSINTHARAINQFLNWLHERGEPSEKLRIQKLREEEKIIRLFDDRELKALSYL